MAAVVNLICACGTPYTARKADVKRGWAKSCSKGCAARRREKELDRNGYRSGEARDEDDLFSTAHLFDNCEQD